MFESGFDSDISAEEIRSESLSGNLSDDILGREDNHFQVEESEGYNSSEISEGTEPKLLFDNSNASDTSWQEDILNQAIPADDYESSVDSDWVQNHL